MPTILVTMEANKIIKKLKTKSDRERVSLYLSSSLLKEFRSYCGNIAPSKVIEELMREFIESAKTPAKKSKKK